MATIYKFDVKVVSPFCAYDSEFIRNELTNVITKWRDTNGNRLESITIQTKDVT